MWLQTIVPPGGRVVQGKLAGEHAHPEGSSPEALAPGYALRRREDLARGFVSQRNTVTFIERMNVTCAITVQMLLEGLFVARWSWRGVSPLLDSDESRVINTGAPD